MLSNASSGLRQQHEVDGETWDAFTGLEKPYTGLFLRGPSFLQRVSSMTTSSFVSSDPLVLETACREDWVRPAVVLRHRVFP